ncbi:hypothetical protein [Agreia sp. COWG]|uniref:hypothetical protein n=1 Tax=Agreia sp. COWG TaxID=2773266 RepID=UPI001925CC18|nr:hypothetical protein [Agreia sp. COWG]CAD6002424.1 conserved membrane protein of unknown function [Agreia sp. COWG]
MSQRIFSSADFKDVPVRRRRGRGAHGAQGAARVGACLVGLVLVLPALFLVMAGGARSYAETVQQGSTQPVPAATVLMAAGLVLVLIVCLSGLFSALGPFFAGVVATACGAAFVADPQLVATVSTHLPAVGATPLMLLVFWCQSGLLLCIGIILLASSLGLVVASRAGAPRRSGRSGARSVVALVVAVVATPAGLALVALGSSGLLTAYGRASGTQAVDAQSLTLLLAGAAALGGVALTTGWSSVGASVAGALALVLGITVVLPVVANGVVTASSRLSGELANGTASVIALGWVAVVGVVLMGAAASASRAHRVH